MKKPELPPVEPALRRAATIDDVARVTGYSTATVSRVFNHSAKVATKTRRAVESAMIELGYVPDFAARSLATSSSRTVGIVVPTIENRTFAIGIMALQQRLRDAGYTLLISSTEYDADQEMEEVRTMVSRGVDGIVLLGGVHHPQMLELLHQRQIPYVTTWVLSDELPCVGFDNRAAGDRIASHLLDLGHVDIAVIASLSPTNDRASARVAGVRDALARRKLSLPDSHVIGGLGVIAEGKTAMRILLAMKKVPTAVICLNDELAFGVLLEAKSRGLTVPGDLSVVGFDDLDFAAELNPALTTVRVPAAEIGTAAADSLLARIQKRPVPGVVALPANLVVRGSTGHPSPSSAPARKRGRETAHST